MGLLDDIKNKAKDAGDRNGDGELNKEDLDQLKGDSNGKGGDLKSKADTNRDGKIDGSDFGGLKDTFLGK